MRTYLLGTEGTPGLGRGSIGLYLIAGCLVAFVRSSTGRRQWALFLGGAILAIVALVLITPLRLRLHEQPLPLDVAPHRDVLGVTVRRCDG